MNRITPILLFVYALMCVSFYIHADIIALEQKKIELEQKINRISLIIADLQKSFSTLDSSDQIEQKKKIASFRTIKKSYQNLLKSLDAEIQKEQTLEAKLEKEEKKEKIDEENKKLAILKNLDVDHDWYRFINRQKYNDKHYVRTVFWSEKPGCGCSLRNTIPYSVDSTDIKTVYAFLPFWECGKAVQIDFQSITRIGYYSLIPDSNGNFDELLHLRYTYQPDNTLSKEKESFRIFVDKVHKYNCKIDLVISMFHNTNSDAAGTHQHNYLTFNSYFALDNMVYHAVQIAKENNFDGITLDFQYLSHSNIAQYKVLVYELFKEIKREIPHKNFMLNIIIAPYITDFTVSPMECNFVDVEMFVDNILVMLEYDKHIEGNYKSILPLEPQKDGIDTTLYMLQEAQYSMPKIIPIIPLYGNLFYNMHSGYKGSFIYSQRAKITKTFKTKLRYNDFLVDEEKTIIADNLYNIEDKMEYVFSLKNKLPNPVKGIGFFSLSYLDNDPDFWNTCNDKLNTIAGKVISEKFLFLSPSLYAWINRVCCPSRMIFRYSFLVLFAILILYYNATAFNCRLKAYKSRYSVWFLAAEIMFILLLLCLYYILRHIDSLFQNSVRDDLILIMLIFYGLVLKFRSFILKATKYKTLP